MIALLIVPVSSLIRSEGGFGSVLLVFCFGLGLYAMKGSIAPAIMSELFPTGYAAWASVPGTTSPSPSSAASLPWSSSGSASATAAGSSGMSRSPQPSRSSPH